MLKRILGAAILAVFVGLQSLPAMATLTNSSTKTDYKTGESTVSVYSALITATSNDTTTSADSNTITNLDGSIKDIYAGVKATNQTGSSPTLTVKFLGSFDNSTWFVIQGVQGGTAGTLGTMISPTLDIATASSTNVQTGTSFSLFGYRPGYLLPPYIKVRITVGGTGTPGWTGTAYAAVKR